MYLQTCVPSEDSNQFAYSHSLIRFITRPCWIDKDATFLPVDNEDSDLTASVRRLIWVFAGHTRYAFSVCGSKILQETITKTRLFKYMENFTSKKLKIFRYKNSDIFHITAQNIDCGYSLEPPRRGGSNEYPQSMFYAVIRKIMYTPVNPSFTI